MCGETENRRTVVLHPNPPPTVEEGTSSSLANGDDSILASPVVGGGRRASARGGWRTLISWIPGCRSHVASECAAKQKITAQLSSTLTLLQRWRREPAAVSPTATYRSLASPVVGGGRRASARGGWRTLIFLDRWMRFAWFRMCGATDNPPHSCPPTLALLQRWRREPARTLEDIAVPTVLSAAICDCHEDASD